MLSFELIHADRNRRGVHLSIGLNRNWTDHRYLIGRESITIFGVHVWYNNIWSDRQPTMDEELATIGLEGLNTDECITENNLRREHGLNDRASYWTD
jgi:hypothetical protein